VTLNVVDQVRLRNSVKFLLVDLDPSVPESSMGFGQTLYFLTYCALRTSRIDVKMLE
jgi:hypothetical protein